MTKQVQRRRGTSTQHTSFTGAEGEISVNTTNKSIHVHDGVTAGGVEAARADLTNVSDANLNAALSGNTLSSLTITSVDINGGTIDGAVIGGSSPAAGTFTTANATTVDTTNIEVTTLKAKDGTSAGSIADSTGVVTLASSVLTTTDINGGTIDGTVIGGSSAAAGTFTTVTASGDVTIADKIVHSGDTNTAIRFPAADTVTVETGGAERLRVDSSGNLGLGVTPSAWNSSYKGFQNAGGALVGVGTGEEALLHNSYIASSGNYTYTNTAAAARYSMAGGVHYWFNAPSGTAGNAVTFTQAMTLDASGRLGVGITSPVFRLDVRSGATATTANFLSTATTSYAPTAYNGLSARLLLQGGSATSAFTGTQFTHGGSCEAFFGVVQNSLGTADFVFQGYNGSAYAEHMRLDASGNLGLKTTPSTWVSGAACIQAGAYAAFGQGRGGTADLIASWNAVVTSGTNGGTGYVYRNTGDIASSYEQNGTHRWYVAPSGTAGNAITFTQAMTLDASGNLLVGTTSALGKFDSYSTTVGNNGWYMSGNFGAPQYPMVRLYAATPGKVSAIGNNGDGSLHFYVNGSSSSIGTFGATIDPNGNLLVGTTSGSDRLTVSGNLMVSGANGLGTAISSDANSNVFIPRAYSVSTSGGVAVFAQSDGRLGPNASSQRYKTEIQSVSDVSWLYQLNPVSFYYKDKDGNKQGMLQYGLIAEEVDAVNPDLVHRMDGQVESVHYHQLYAPLLKAIQELKAEVDSLRAQLNP